MRPAQRPDYKEIRSGKPGVKRFRYVGDPAAPPDERAYSGDLERRHQLTPELRARAKGQLRHLEAELRRLERKPVRTTKGQAVADLKAAKRRRDRRRRRERARGR